MALLLETFDVFLASYEDTQLARFTCRSCCDMCRAEEAPQKRNKDDMGLHGDVAMILVVVKLFVMRILCARS